MWNLYRSIYCTTITVVILHTHTNIHTQPYYPQTHTHTSPHNYNEDYTQYMYLMDEKTLHKYSNQDMHDNQPTEISWLHNFIFIYKH